MHGFGSDTEEAVAAVAEYRRPERKRAYHIYNGPHPSSENQTDFQHDTTVIWAASFEDALDQVIARPWYLVDGQALILVEDGDILRVYEYIGPTPAHFHLI